MVALSAALLVTLLQLGDAGTWTLALLPLFVGLAYLAVHRFASTNPSRSDP